jgi:hypothetical protein
MADAVAVASLVATPTIVAAYSYFQKRYELQRADRAELRKTLDNAANQFGVVQRMSEDFSVLWGRGVQASADQYGELVARHLQSLPEARAAIDQIAIRAGRRAPVYATYRAAMDRVNDYRNLCMRGIEEGQPYDSEQVLRLREGAVDARGAFLDAATAVAGSTDERAQSPLYPTLPLPPDRKS